MKTKLLSLITVVFCVLLLFTGCGGSDNSSSGVASGNAGGSADDTVYKLKFSSVRHEHSWYKTFYDDMIAEINEKSNGRLVIEPFYNNTLGAPPDIWTMFQQGGIDILETTPGMIGSFPVSEVVNIPVLLKNNTEIGDVMWALYHAGYLDEFTDHMKVLMFQPNDMLFPFTTDKKIESVEDFKGLKLRGSSNMLSTALNELGATSVSVSHSDVTMSLSQGVIDGCITGYSFVELSSLDESCNYIMDTPFGGSMMFIGISNQTWAKLPADLKLILLEVSDKYYQIFVENVFDDGQALLKAAKDEWGMEIYAPAPEVVEHINSTTDTMINIYRQNLEEKGLDADGIMNLVNKILYRCEEFIR